MKSLKEPMIQMRAMENLKKFPQSYPLLKLFHKKNVSVKQIDNLIDRLTKQFPKETYPNQLIETEVLKISWTNLAELENIKEPEKYLPFIYKLTELEYSKLINFSHLI